MKPTFSKKLDSLLANTADVALKRRARRLIEELDPQLGEKILDAGCGDGFYLHLLSNLGDFELVGLDSDPLALQSAKRNLKGKKIKLVKGDLLKTPFRDNSFDKIVCSEVLEHLKDDLAGLKELKRVLKPKGVLMITVPNHNYPFFWDPINWILERVSRTHLKSGFWAGIWSQHLRLYYPKELKDLIKKTGLGIERHECPTCCCLPFNHHLVNLGARILVGGTLSEKTRQGVDKFSSEKPRRSFLVELFFKMSNWADSFNRKTNCGASAVSVLAKAIKED